MRERERIRALNFAEAKPYFSTDFGAAGNFGETFFGSERLACGNVKTSKIGDRVANNWQAGKIDSPRCSENPFSGKARHPVYVSSFNSARVLTHVQTG